MSAPVSADHTNDHDFGQMIAECRVKLGEEIVDPIVIAHADRWGWPIPVNVRPALLIQLGRLMKEKGLA